MRPPTDMHRPGFDSWGLEMAKPRLAAHVETPAERTQRRRVRIAWLRLSWLALVCAAASMLTAHLAG